MLCYQLWTVSCGETSVEAQDHDVYRNVAKSRGEVSSAKIKSSVDFNFSVPSRLLSILMISGEYRMMLFQRQI